MKRILVTGGAGYIGSHTALQLAEAGCHVVVLDNLCAGHRRAAPDCLGFEQARFVQGDAGDRELVGKILADHRIDAVIHFAAHVVVPESVENPAKYYRNNTLGSLDLIEACIDGGVGRFVFSSSAAVYGAPQSNPVSEDAPTVPVNPYGSSKLMTEWTLRDLAAAAATRPGEEGLRYVALRYFNVAGARLDGALGQSTPRATHLIKVACEAACGVRDGLRIFGDDYPTRDGTCIRDYIHVEDLAKAHLDALHYLDRGGASVVMNCGYGRGHSVAEVIECVKAVSGVDFPVRVAARRAGDPPELVADNALIRRCFGWRPRYDDLPTICRTAYRWERALMKRGG